MMENKLKSCLIASTPHPQSRRILRNGFENDSLSCLSPIGQVSLASFKPTIPKSKLALHPDKANKEEKIKKRKYTTVQKDSATSVALQGLRGKATATSGPRTNILTHSRNIYNIYPEPIVLDSDEEEKFLKSITIHKNTPQKKVTKTTAEAAKLKNPDRKKPARKKIRTVLDSEEEEESIKSVQKPTAEKKLTKNDTTKLTKSEKNGEFNKNTGSGTQTEESRSKLSRLAYEQKKEAGSSSLKAFDIKSPEQKPLGNLENIQPTANKRTKCVKTSTKPITVNETDLNDILLNEESSPFPHLPVNYSKTAKLVNLNHTPIVKDLIDKNTIKWTPRALKKVKRVSVSSTSEEDTDDECDIKKNSKDGTVDNTTQRIKNIPSAVTSHDVSTTTTSHGCIKKREQTENCFPTGCLSRFENIVFKPSSHSGGIVAKSLQTDTLNFGYVEIKKGETFSGQRTHVTFVMLEGLVKASVQGGTQTLLPGDIIHINAVSDSKYHFQNFGSDHSRLLFVKEKACL